MCDLRWMVSLRCISYTASLHPLESMIITQRLNEGRKKADDDGRGHATLPSCSSWTSRGRPSCSNTKLLSVYLVIIGARCPNQKPNEAGDSVTGSVESGK